MPVRRSRSLYKTSLWLSWFAVDGAVRRRAVRAACDGAVDAVCGGAADGVCGGAAAASVCGGAVAASVCGGAVAASVCGEAVDEVCGGAVAGVSSRVSMVEPGVVVEMYVNIPE